MELKRTPLYDIHDKAGAKFTDFSGWKMPVEYGSVIDEHQAVRSAAGLFDACHMGEIELKGRGAFTAVQRLTTNDASRLRLGRAQYTLLCNENGGVIDDVIVYCIAPDHFLVCVNASNTAKVLKWFEEQKLKNVAVGDLSDDTALIAIQGPASAEILKGVAEFKPEKLKPFGFLKGKMAGAQMVIARTGYTGEDGFELFLGNDDAPRVWEALMAVGAPVGLKPAGLAARDTLRLEMGYPLYGQELNEEITPLEANLSRFVSFERDDFIGKSALQKQSEEGVTKKLVGLTLTGRGIARSGYRILSGGEEVGTVTSGTHSPTLKKPIAMGFVKSGLAEPGTSIDIEIRSKPVGAVVTKMPFYKREK